MISVFWVFAGEIVWSRSVFYPRFWLILHFLDQFCTGMSVFLRFIRFQVACLDSGLGPSGTKDSRYAGFDIWYLIPIWYQNLPLIDQISINIKFDVWSIKFGSNLIQIWFWYILYQIFDLIDQIWYQIWYRNIKFDIKFDVWSIRFIWSIKIWSRIWFDRSNLIGGGIKDTPPCCITLCRQTV